MKKLSALIVFTIFASASVFAERKTDTEATEENAVLHIYRPSRIVGFSWVFNLKLEGERIAKVRNGKYVTVELSSGQKEFKMNNSFLEMDLEPGKHYFLRASLASNMFVGKPEIVEVTERQAKKEIANL